jgi:acyl-CoA-dependent ceramide synthase
MGYATLCDIAFGLFMVSWIIARHAFYLTICWSIYRDIPLEINYGCYRGGRGNLTGPFPVPTSGLGHLIEPFRDPEGIVCFNDNVKWGFLSGLLFLQGITIMWFVMVLRVAIRVLRGGSADDTRSDDEGEEEEEEADVDFVNEKPPSAQRYVAQEVGIEEINLVGRKGSAARSKKSGARATGVTLDRKELLGRIGCDKPQ